MERIIETEGSPGFELMTKEERQSIVTSILTIVEKHFANKEKQV